MSFQDNHTQASTIMSNSHHRNKDHHEMKNGILNNTFNNVFVESGDVDSSRGCGAVGGASSICVDENNLKMNTKDDDQQQQVVDCNHSSNDQRLSCCIETANPTELDSSGQVQVQLEVHTNLSMELQEALYRAKKAEELLKKYQECVRLITNQLKYSDLGLVSTTTPPTTPISVSTSTSTSSSNSSSSSSSTTPPSSPRCIGHHTTTIESSPIRKGDDDKVTCSLHHQEQHHNSFDNCQVEKKIHKYSYHRNHTNIHDDINVPVLLHDNENVSSRPDVDKGSCEYFHLMSSSDNNDKTIMKDIDIVNNNKNNNKNNKTNNNNDIHHHPRYSDQEEEGNRTRTNTATSSSSCWSCSQSVATSANNNSNNNMSNNNKNNILTVSSFVDEQEKFHTALKEIMFEKEDHDHDQQQQQLDPHHNEHLLCGSIESMSSDSSTSRMILTKDFISLHEVVHQIQDHTNLIYLDSYETSLDLCSVQTSLKEWILKANTIESFYHTLEKQYDELFNENCKLKKEKKILKQSYKKLKLKQHTNLVHSMEQYVTNAIYIHEKHLKQQPQQPQPKEQQEPKQVCDTSNVIVDTLSSSTTTTTTELVSSDNAIITVSNSELSSTTPVVSDSIVVKTSGEIRDDEKEKKNTLLLHPDTTKLISPSTATATANTTTSTVSNESTNHTHPQVPNNTNASTSSTSKNGIFSMFNHFLKESELQQKRHQGLRIETIGTPFALKHNEKKKQEVEVKENRNTDQVVHSGTVSTKVNDKGYTEEMKDSTPVTLSIPLNNNDELEKKEKNRSNSITETKNNHDDTIKVMSTTDSDLNIDQTIIHTPYEPIRIEIKANNSNSTSVTASQSSGTPTIHRSIITKESSSNSNSSSHKNIVSGNLGARVMSFINPPFGGGGGSGTAVQSSSDVVRDKTDHHVLPTDKIATDPLVRMDKDVCNIIPTNVPLVKQIQQLHQMKQKEKVKQQQEKEEDVAEEYHGAFRPLIRAKDLRMVKEVQGFQDEFMIRPTKIPSVLSETKCTTSSSTTTTTQRLIESNCTTIAGQDITLRQQHKLTENSSSIENEKSTRHIASHHGTNTHDNIHKNSTTIHKIQSHYESPSSIRFSIDFSDLHMLRSLSIPTDPSL